MALLPALTRGKKPPPVRPVARPVLLQAGAPLPSIFGWNPRAAEAIDYPWQFATEEEALGLPVIGGFVQLITSLLLQMPLQAHRSVPGRPEVVVTPAPGIIQNPCPGPCRTIGVWVTEYLRDMILYGNYVAVLGKLNAQGWPDVMYPVPQEQWELVHTGAEIWDYHYMVNGARYEPDEIFHVRINVRSGEMVGRGILNLYSRLIATCVAAERWAALYFDGGAVPPAQVEHPNPELTQEQADDLKAKYNMAVRRREAIVTPVGTVVRPLDSDAESAQLTDTRRMNSQQLAMAVGIPGALLGLDAPSLTYRNITDVFQQLMTTTVMSYIVPLEQQLSHQCLPRGTEARFYQSNVLRPDIAARVALAVEAFQGGVVSVDEARVLFDLASISNLETKLSPGPDPINSEEG